MFYFYSSVAHNFLKYKINVSTIFHLATVTLNQIKPFVTPDSFTDYTNVWIDIFGLIFMLMCPNNNERNAWGSSGLIDFREDKKNE